METPAPTLSVCTFTDRSAAHVALVLAPLRSVVDEIVVVLDHRVAVDGIDALDGVADRVVRAEYEAPLEANLPWMHSLCTSDWVLRLDGDELPSQALVRRLADRSWQADITHAFVNRRWVWGNGSRVLDEHPWWPDPQLRIVRNSTGMVAFPTNTHDLPVIGGFRRYLDEAIYHLDLMVSDEGERRAKAATYERDHPGLRTEDGRPQNLGFYVPESAGRDLRTNEVADEDRPFVLAAIESYVGSAPGGSVDPGEVVSVVSRHPTPPSDGDGEVELVDLGPTMWRAGSSATVTVRVTNRSDVVWSPMDRPPVRLGGKLLDGAGTPVTGELRAELPCPVAPGGSENVRITFAPLPTAGIHQVEVQLVREEMGWFGPPATTDVTVIDRPRVVITGGFARYRHLGDDLIVSTVIEALTTSVPDAELVLLADDPIDASARFGPRSVGSAGEVIHRAGRADLRTALRRVEALRRDARRHAAGEPVQDPLHLALIDTIAGADVVVAPGAGWFTDKFRDAQVIPRLAEIEVARALGVPYLFEAGTVGPFSSRAGRLLARRALGGMTRITVRDGAVSIDLAHRLGAADVVSVPDVATAAAAAGDRELSAWLAARGVDPTEPYAVVSIRDQRDTISDHDGPATIHTVVGAVRELGGRGLPVIFLPHCIHPMTDDVPAGREVAERSPLFVDGQMPSDAVAVALVANAAVTVGNRYHLALLADAHAVPSLFLAATEFDHGRSGSFTGGNVEVVSAGDEQVGAEAAARALARKDPRPADHWDPEPLLTAVRAAVVDRPVRTR